MKTHGVWLQQKWWIMDVKWWLKQHRGPGVLGGGALPALTPFWDKQEGTAGPGSPSQPENAWDHGVGLPGQTAEMAACMRRDFCQMLRGGRLPLLVLHKSYPGATGYYKKVVYETPLHFKDHFLATSGQEFLFFPLIIIDESKPKTWQLSMAGKLNTLTSMQHIKLLFYCFCCFVFVLFFF